MARLLVREGDTVTAGQQLAVLDDDVHQSLLAIARQRMESTGRLNAAMAELEMHKRR